MKRNIIYAATIIIFNQWITDQKGQNKQHLDSMCVCVICMNYKLNMFPVISCKDFSCIHFPVLSISHHATHYDWDEEFT